MISRLLSASRAAAGTRQHIRFGLMQPLDAGGGALDNRLELSAAVADRNGGSRHSKALSGRVGPGSFMGQLVPDGSAREGG